VLIAVPESRVADLRKAGSVEVRLWSAPNVALRGRVGDRAQRRCRDPDLRGAGDDTRHQPACSWA
jgi:hypothetical protein